MLRFSHLYWPSFLSKFRIFVTEKNEYASHTRWWWKPEIIFRLIKNSWEIVGSLLNMLFPLAERRVWLMTVTLKIHANLSLHLELLKNLKGISKAVKKLKEFQLNIANQNYSAIRHTPSQASQKNCELSKKKKKKSHKNFDLIPKL